MAKEQLHIIQTQVFEVEYFSRENTHTLQNRISYLYHSKVVPALSALFDRMVAETEYLRIDSMSIDLGTLDEAWDDDTLLAEIMAAIEQELSRKLANRIRNLNPGLNTDEGNQENRLMSLVEYFLLNGSQPWWAADHQQVDWDQTLATLFSLSKSNLAGLIFRLGSYAHVRQRMVYQFKESSVRLIIQLLEPENSVFIYNIHADISRAQHRQQLVKNQTDSFERAVWEFILSYLMLDNRSFFNRLNFLESTLKRLAAHFNLTYKAVLSLFSVAIPPGRRAAVYDLPDLLFLLSIKYDQNAYESAINEKSSIAETTLPDEFDPVATRLKYHHLINEIQLSHARDQPVLPDELENLPLRWASENDQPEPDGQSNSIWSANEEINFSSFKQDKLQKFEANLVNEDNMPERIDQNKVLENFIDTELLFGPNRSHMPYFNDARLHHVELRQDYAWSNIEYYLRFGSLPVWMDHVDRNYFSFNFFKLITGTKIWKVKLMELLQSDERAHQRFLEAFNLDELYVLLGTCYDPQTLPEKVFFGTLFKYAVKKGLSLSEFKQKIFGNIITTGLSNQNSQKLFPAHTFVAYIRKEGLITEIEWNQLFASYISHYHADSKEVVEFIQNNQSARTPVDHSEDQERQINVKDVFAYFLIHGKWPWWYATTHKDLGSVFRTLIKSEARYLIQLLNYVQGEAELKYHLLTMLSTEELMEGFSILFPSAKDGALACQFILANLQHTSIQHENVSGVKRNLVGIYLEFLLQGSSAGFDMKAFMNLAISYVATVAGMTAREWIGGLLENPVEIPEIKSIIQAIGRTEDRSVLSNVIEYNFYEQIHQSDLTWLSESNAWLKNKTETTESILIQDFYKHLLNDQLYPAFGIREITQVKWMERLRAFISNWEQGIALPGNEPGSDDLSTEDLTTLSELLESRLKKNQLSVSHAAIDKAIMVLEKQIKPGEFPDSAVPMQNSGQLAFWAIDFFLKHGQLPSHYICSNRREEQILLKQILRLAVYWNHSKLYTLLSNAGYNKPALEKLASLSFFALNDQDLILPMSIYIQRHLPQMLADLGFEYQLAKEQHVKEFLKQRDKSGKLIWPELLTHRQIRMELAKKNSIQDLASALENLNKGWSGEHLNQILIAYNWMSDQISDTLEKSRLQMLVKEFILLQLFVRNNRIDLKLFFEELLKFIYLERKLIFQQLLEVHVLKIARQGRLRPETPVVLAEAMQLLQAVYAKKEQIKNQFRTLEMDRIEGLSNEEQLFAFGEEGLGKLPSFESDLELSGESFVVHNAGLVLLHPYLKPFFSNLGLLKAGKFVSDRSRFKAIHVLQYLIDGNLEHPEEVLVLNKILCGWPVKAPVSLQIRLTSEQKKHCEDFISAILSMWEQMKSSSHANFRGSFLKRSGVLRNEGGDWNLRVEPAGYDILLQTLPWGYGVVKNSLMDSTLYVEWQA